MKSGVGLALLALLKDDAIFTTASLSCHRVASQWTVAFTKECTEWFQMGGSETHEIPNACEQGFIGAVAVDEFPWNDGVVVVDNEEPADNFNLQPAQQVVQHGAGVVIMQTTWDMIDHGQWRARNMSMARRVHPEVHYLSSGEEKYVDLDVHVNFVPRGANAVAWEGKAGGGEPTEAYGGNYESTYEYNEDDDVNLAADISPFSSWFSYDLEADMELGGHDNMHHHSHVFSYDHEPHGHKVPGPFHPEDFGSFSYDYMHDEPDSRHWIDSYDFSDSMPHHPHVFSYDHEPHGHKVPGPFHLKDFGSFSYGFMHDEPDSRQWVDSYDFSDSFSDMFSFDFDENDPPELHDVHTVTSMDVYVCSDEGRPLEDSGFFCDPYNRGAQQCYKNANPSDVKALSLKKMKMYCDAECLSDEVGGLWCDIFGLNGCRMCKEDCDKVCAEDENCQCVQCDHGAPGGMVTPPPSPESTGYFTPSPTEAFTTSAPSMGPTGFDASAAPTAVGSMTFETLTPTVGLGRDLLDSFMMSAAPTIDESAVMSAAPTIDESAGCTYGDDESCYDKLEATEQADLDRGSIGLTCEESCITDYGPWCNAMGIRGCRFCSFDCEVYCAKIGALEDCVCFEC